MADGKWRPGDRKTYTGKTPVSKVPKPGTTKGLTPVPKAPRPSGGGNGGKK